MLISARPVNLKKFVDDTRAVSRTAHTDVTDLRASWDAFARAANELGPADTGLLDGGPEGALGRQLDRWRRQEDFVELVQHGFEQSDRFPGGVVTIGDWRLDWRMRDEARRRGIDLSALLHDPGALAIPPPLMGTPVPYDSGFVEDPVCTATGHYLEEALDLAMPARLGLLAWPRVHSSRHRVTGGHGRGWGSWASAALARQADGSLAYTGPDGQRLRLAPDGAGGWRRTVWLRARAVPAGGGGGDGGGDGDGGGVDRADRTAGADGADRADGGGVELRWDRVSPHPAEVWVFRPDGTPAEVRSPDHGTTRCEHDDGRLVRLVHEGGRSLDVRWDDGRIAEVVGSCGRSVRYRYDDRGDLVAVESAREPRRYDLDAAGRIVAARDADGVRLCHNTYDDRGRVRRQVSPFGRTTTFDYGDGVTVVGDTDGGPVSRWEHDRQGRLVGLVDADGHRMDRTYDDGGRPRSITGFGGAATTFAHNAAGHLIARRDPRGEERFAHDDQGRVVRHDRPDGSWTAYGYGDDAGSLPSRVHGPEGWELVVDRDRGVVRRIVDADGVAVTVDSDADGCPVAVIDGLGHTTRLAVHASGEVAAVTLPDGTTWTIDRDDAGRPTAVTAPDGGRTTIGWTPAGRLHEVVGPGGAATRYEHGDHGEVTAVVDALGRRVALQHDRLGWVAALVDGDRRWSFDRTALGLVAAVHDPAGATWAFEHDAEGATVAAVDPTGHRQAFDHDEAGDLVRVVDAAGGLTSYGRDAAGRVVAVVDPEGAATTVAHDGHGRRTGVTDPDGGRVTRHHTPAGRLAAELTGEGRGSRHRYDAAGRLAASVDALGGTTTYERDPVGRVVAVTGPDGRTRRFTHDAAGRVVASEEPGGAVWRTGYDLDGRVVSTTDPTGATTRFAYDAAGRLVAATDPLGHTTTWTWDDRGRCTAVTDPLGHTTGYRWDDRDRCVAAVDALGQVTAVAYDAAGRPVAVDLPGGGRVEHRLDPAGRLVELLVDGRAVLRQAFDRAGRPVEVTEPGAGRAHRLAWSPGGRLTGLDAGGATWSWRHDGDGLVVAAKDPTGRTTTYGHDAAGLLVEQRTDGGVGLRLERDAAGRLVGFDGPGRRRRLAYDEAGRLVRQDDGAGAGGPPVTWEHDAAGRIVAPGGATYGYDAAGQLVAAGSATYGYDAAGRLVAEPGRRYRYDALHRLVAVEGEGAATFGYDPLGRRTHRTDAAGTTRYRWDGLGRLAGIEHPDGTHRRLDVDAFGSLVAVDGTPLLWDPHGPVPELRHLGDRAVVGVAGVTLGLAADAAGPEGVAWLDGDWRGSAQPTDPWGVAGQGRGGPGPGGPAPHGPDGPAPGFLGELGIDGLVWLRHRAYDPATRQFLSPDPLAGEPGSPVSAHPYHYAANDPIGQADPLGLAPMSIEAYQQHRKVTTGVQWKNVVFTVEVALSVALMFTPLGPANAARMFAMAGPRIALGAGTKMGGMAVNGSLQTAVWELAGQKIDEGLAWDEVRWGTVGKGTLFGGVGTMFGGAVGPRLGANVISPVVTKALRVPGKPANVVSSWATSSVLLGTTSAGYETYDLTNLPGSDGWFKPSNVIASTVSAVPYTVAGGFVVPIKALPPAVAPPRAP